MNYDQRGKLGVQQERKRKEWHVRVFLPKVTSRGRGHHQLSILQIHMPGRLKNEQETNAGDGDGDSHDASVCMQWNRSGQHHDGHEQMMEIAYGDIDVEGMMPKEFESQDIPGFSLRLNILPP